MRVFQYLYCFFFLISLGLFACTNNTPSENTTEVIPKDTLNATTPVDQQPKENGTAIATSTPTISTSPKVEEVSKKIPAKASGKKKKRTKKRKKQAGISFDNQTYSYGTIRQGDQVEHQFYFTNTGNAPLTITDVKVSCGCTQPSYPFIPIEPGEKGYIGITFDSKGKLGKQRPAITVITNATPATHKLYLEGYVDTNKEVTE